MKRLFKFCMFVTAEVVWTTKLRPSSENVKLIPMAARKKSHTVSTLLKLISALSSNRRKILRLRELVK